MSTNHRKLSRIACIIAVIMLFISCPLSNYENVRLDKKSDGLIFHPDQNAPREPMPLNISAFIAHSCGRWGVLFNVPYRETGLRAINKTIFTSVLYLAVVDEGLNTYTRKPILIHKKKALAHSISREPTTGLPYPISRAITGLSACRRMHLFGK